MAKLLAKRLSLDYFSPGMTVKTMIGGEETKAVIKGLESGLLTNKIFQRELQDRQLQAAHKGNIVIDGKLAIHTLSRFATLSTWLTASREIRISRIAQRGNYPYEEAQSLLEARETKELDAWHATLGIDFWSQANQADIRVDTSEISPTEVTNTILTQLARIK